VIAHKEIVRLVRLLENSQLGLIELGHNGRKIRLTKYPKKDQWPAPNPLKKTGAATDLTESKRQANKNFILRSTLIGLVYSVSVATGEFIKKGQILCLVKSLGLDYEIVSPTDGRVKTIFISETEIIDYDKPLFEIETEDNSPAEK